MAERGSARSEREQDANLALRAVDLLQESRVEDAIQLLLNNVDAFDREVVPLSALREVEQERNEARANAERADRLRGVAAASYNAETELRWKVEAERDRLRELLEEWVAAREPFHQFPSRVTMSVALERVHTAEARARAALAALEGDDA